MAVKKVLKKYRVSYIIASSEENEIEQKISVYHASLNDTPCGAKMVPKINANKITVNNSSVKTIF